MCTSIKTSIQVTFSTFEQRENEEKQYPISIVDLRIINCSRFWLYWRLISVLTRFHLKKTIILLFVVVADKNITKATNTNQDEIHWNGQIDQIKYAFFELNFLLIVSRSFDLFFSCNYLSGCYFSHVAEINRTYKL